MWHDLRLFMGERCPLAVVLPLAAVLYGAPAMLGESAGWISLTGALSTLGGLVVLRAVDDLSDLDEDRRCHPRRGLVNGRIQPAGLRRAALWLGILVLGLNFRPPGSIYMALLLGAYLLFFGLKGRLPVGWQPLWGNVYFAVIPLYAAGWSPAAFLLALFVWLAVVGHDFCHSVHAHDEGCPNRRTPSTCWGPRGAALTGTGAYLLALAAGAGFWTAAGRPLLFVLALAASALGLLILGTALVIKPCRHRARAFYVPGFLFFILPLAGFIVDSLVL